METEEFDCIDCAAPIVRLGGWPGQPKRCAGCEFLTWIEDPVAREVMRAHMLKEHTIGPDRQVEELSPPKSVAIERLIEEVRRDGADGNPNAYNRTYSRHNRS